MAMKTRALRKADFLIKVQSEIGWAELLKKLRFQLGLQPDQTLPPGSSLVGGLLDNELAQWETLSSMSRITRGFHTTPISRPF